MKLVLGDLGLARNQQNNLNIITGTVGTTCYFAPEVAEGSGNYNEKIDVW